jgi:hypothetical protein
MMPIKKIADMSDLVTKLHLASEALVYFYPKKRGRPPTVRRDHLEALMSLIKTLIDDIDECLNHMLPEKRQVEDLIRVYDYLMHIKKRYMIRIDSLKRCGLLELRDKIGMEEE